VLEQSTTTSQSRWLVIILLCAILVGFVFLLRPSSHRLNFVLRHLLPAQFTDLGFAPLAFSPDGQLLAVAEKQYGVMNGVKVWQVSEGQIVHAFPIAFWIHGLSLAFSPDGKLLAVGCMDDAVRIYNIADGKLKKVLGKPISWMGSGVRAIAFSPDGKLLAMGIQNKVVVWEVESGKRVQTLQINLRPSPWVRTVSFSQDGQWLVAGSDGVIQLWKVSNWKCVHRFPFARCLHVAFREGCRQLAAVSWNKVQVWRLPEGSTVPSTLPNFATSFPRDGKFSSDGELVAVTNWQTSFWLARIKDWSQQLIPKFINPFAHLNPSRGGVSIWRLSDGKRVAQLMRSEDGLPIGVAISPDGRFVAVGYSTSKVAIWERQ
jgi:WD40 repeat protein